MLRLVLAASAAALISSAAFAEPGAGGLQSAPEPSSNSATTADPSASADPSKVICKNVKPATGTRLTSSRSRQRICMTKADWEQQEAEAQEAARGARNSANTMPNESSPAGH